jgi:hypothetical protein
MEGSAAHPLDSQRFSFAKPQWPLAERFPLFSFLWGAPPFTTAIGDIAKQRLYLY